MSIAVIPVVDEGLGNSAYLVDLGDGRTITVDASRDLRELRASAERRGSQIASAADDGATVLPSRAGERELLDRGPADGDDLALGGLRLRTRTTPGHTLVSVEHVGESGVLDTRQSSEFTKGHTPGAAHIELGHLAEHPASTGPAAQGPTVVMCGRGERAMGAASLLARAGQRDLSGLVGGPHDWAVVTGRSLEEGA